MGLLDDAIREHLELKRLGGADAGQVAREEQDALGPVLRNDHSLQGDDDSFDAKVLEADRSLSTDAESAPHVEPSAAGQETVEINMEAELSGGADSESPNVPQREPVPPAAAHPAHAKGAPEDSLEWEVPGETAQNPAASGAGGDPRLDGDDDDGEHVEDVLEETPDFLRDTPEQERLWFEQRPPRDFDFNE